MIIGMIRRMFSGTVYIQLREDRIRICHIENKSIYDQRPYIAIDSSNRKKKIIHAIGNEAYNLRANANFDVSNPFSHPRMLVSNFLKAESVLTHGIREVHQSKFIAPSPVVIMHPMEKLEGGITDIEGRVYRELAIAAGARDVRIHVGNTLSISLFNMDQVCEPESV